MAEGPDTDAEALRRLQQRLDRAAEAAQRLLADAVVGGLGASDRPADPPAGAAPPGSAGAASPPPAGWQRPAPNGDPGRGREQDLLLSVLASLRDRIPPELLQRLAEAIRDVLLALRALIDWFLERSERQRTEPARVQDIPIL